MESKRAGSYVAPVSLSSLGYLPEQLADINRLGRRDSGNVVLSCDLGSGKSITVNAARSWKSEGKSNEK